MVKTFCGTDKTVKPEGNGKYAVTSLSAVSSRFGKDNSKTAYTRVPLASQSPETCPVARSVHQFKNQATI